MTFARQGRGLAALALALGLGLASEARAEPIVVVHLRVEGGASVDATVEVRDGATSLGRCHTAAQTCEIRGVPPGRHTVVARADDGRESRPHTVVIPPDGKVSLWVTLP